MTSQILLYTKPDPKSRLNQRNRKMKLKQKNVFLKLFLQVEGSFLKSVQE